MGQGPVQELCPSDPPALQFRISEYAPPNMVGAEQPPSPELRREGVAEYEDGEAPARGGGADPQQPGRSLRPAAGPLRRLGESRTRRGAEARGVARRGVARVPAGVPGPACWS